MPIPNRIREYDEYIISLINRKVVKNLLKECGINKVKLPRVFSSPSCGVNVAGQTWIYKTGEADIELSSWILVSKIETKRVIRHEVAHILKAICKLPGSSHGKAFNSTLKLVSPRMWRKDRHWYQSKVIDQARKIHHPRLKEIGIDKPEH